MIQALHLEERPFIGIEAEPAQPFEYLVDRLSRGARGVGILDPQHEDPAMAFREQPVKEGRPRPTDVEEAGEDRCEAGASGHLVGPDSGARILTELESEMGSAEIDCCHPNGR